MRPFTVFLLVLATAIQGCGDGSSTPEWEKARKEAAYIDLNKDQVKERLKDPDSAQFRDVFVSNTGGLPVVCGEVNAKNSFGGYGGFQRFISAGTLQLVAKDMAAGEFDTSWVKFCGHRG
jgi:hypothetical protein